MYYLINEKVEGIEHVFSDSISPQCDIIIFTGKPEKTFGEIVIVNSKDVIAVIEVKCSIDRKKFENTLVNFRKLARMGVKNKYLFIFNSCSLRSIHSYFYPQNAKDEVAIAQIFNPLYDHGDEIWLPNAVVGVNKNYCLCQNYVISDRDQFGYTFYRLKNDAENISCLQLFLSHLFCNIDSMCKGENSFDIDFNSMIEEYSFGLYQL